MYVSPSTLSEENLVTIEDQSGDSVNVKIISGNDNSYIISSEDGYTPGECYTISLKDNAPLIFDGKDEDVRQISFSVKRDDSNVSSIKEDDFKHYSSNIIESIYDVDTDNMYLITTSSISATKDDIIVFDYDDGEDLYIKFISISSIDSLRYKVSYKDPEADDIFSSLDLHKENQEIDMEEYFNAYDEEKIKSSILNSDFVKEYAAAVAYTYNFSNGWIDFWKTAKVNLKFNLDKTKFNFEFNVTFTHLTNDGFFYSAGLVLQYTRELTITADAKLKWKLVVPYVSMNSTIVADDSVNVRFQVMLVKKAWNEKYQKMTDPNKLKWDEAKDAVKDLKDHVKSSEETKTSAINKKITGNLLSIPLGTLRIPLAVVPLSIDIDLSINVSVDMSVGLVVGYSWHQWQVFLQYSNSNKKESKGSTSPEIQKASSVNFDFVGSLYVEAYLDISVSLFLNGLKKIFRLQVSVDGGLYLSVSGYGGASYDFVTQTLSEEAGGEAIFGAFIRITLSVVLLNTHNINYKLYEKKIPFIDLGISQNILSLTNNPDVYITKKKTNLNDTNALSFNIFDGTTLSNKIKSYKYNEKVTAVSGLMVSHDVTYDIFKAMKIENSNYITLSDGVLTIKDGAPKSFDANLKVTIYSSNESLPDWDVTIPFHITQTESYYELLMKIHQLERLME